MAKLKGPFLSSMASGSIGNIITSRKQRGQYIGEKYNKPGSKNLLPHHHDN